MHRERERERARALTSAVAPPPLSLSLHSRPRARARSRAESFLPLLYVLAYCADAECLPDIRTRLGFTKCEACAAADFVFVAATDDASPASMMNCSLARSLHFNAPLTP